MSRDSMSIVLSIVSLTFLLCLPATGQTRPEKWEYKSIGACDEIDLNKLGDEGWELISMSFDNNGHCRSAYLKRPKTEFFNPPPTTPPPPPQPAGPPKCNLTPAQAPVIRGIRLGMSIDELLALFPRSKEQSEIINAPVYAERNYGQVFLDFRRETYPENNVMFSNNINRYAITLFDGRVASFYVGYNFPSQNNRSHNWTNMTWIPKLSETYNLPKLEDWRVNPVESTTKLACQGFQVELSASGSNTSIAIIGPPYNEQIKQRREAASAKLRSEFKP